MRLLRRHRGCVVTSVRVYVGITTGRHRIAAVEGRRGLLILLLFLVVHALGGCCPGRVKAAKCIFIVGRRSRQRLRRVELGRRHRSDSRISFHGVEGVVVEMGRRPRRDGI